MKKAHIEPFFATLKAANPMPNTELEYTTVFELLAAGTPQKILALGLAGLEDHIKTIGLFHSKARHLLATCEMLINEHGGQVPRTREALEALPGVGRKTANVVLNVAFGQPTMAVDTHIFRLGNRTGLAPGKTPLAVEQQLMKRIPAQYVVDAHHWLILHGRYVCQARTPQCWRCRVAQWCDFKPKTVKPIK
jgi:endonuclease III